MSNYNIHQQRKNLTSYLIILVIVLVGCTTKYNPQTLTVAGSRSVLPSVQELATAYQNENSAVQIDVQGIGSSAGIEAVLSGIAEIGMASRDLKDEEKTKLESVTIAYDAIAIIVHPENSVDNLTVEQVRDIFAGKITNWQDVGGKNLAIVLVDRDPGSGTKEVFDELLMGEGVTTTDKALVIDGTGAARAVVGNDIAAIGYISFASVDETVRPIKLGGVEPSVENVQNGSYFLFRPFVLVYQKGIISNVGLDFLDFIHSSKGQTIIKNADLILAK